MQIDNSQHLARSGEGSSDASGVIREDVLAGTRLALNDFPRLGGELEAPVVSVFRTWVLGVSYQSRALCFVEIGPFKPANLGLALC